jgi:hypothetical protein
MYNAGDGTQDLSHPTQELYIELYPQFLLFTNVRKSRSVYLYPPSFFK